MKNRIHVTFSGLLISYILFIANVYGSLSYIWVANIGTAAFALAALYLADLNIKKALFSMTGLVPSVIGGLIIAGAHYPLGNFSIATMIVYCIGLTIFFKVLLYGFAYSGQKIYTQDERTKGDAKVVFWGICVLVVFCLALRWSQSYPAGSSPDTINQWKQIHNEIPLNDIHAIGHTLFMKALLSLYDNYAIVIFIQIVAVATSLAVISRYLYLRGIDYRLMVLAVSLFFTYRPFVSIFIYPWKDVPYAICLLLISFAIMKVQRDEQLIVPQLIGLGFMLAGVGLFRLNGMLPMILVALYFVVIALKQRKVRLIAIPAIALVAILMMNLVAYMVLDTQRTENGFSVAVFGSGISAVVAMDGDIAPEQMEEIRQILPVEWMKEKYTTWDHNGLLWDEEPDFIRPAIKIPSNSFVAALGAHKGDVIRLYFALLPRNIILYAKDFLYNTRILWGMNNESFIFSNVFLFVLMVLSVCVLWKRKTIKKYWPVFIPVTGSMVSVMAAITNEYRYVMPTVLLFLPLLFYIILIHNEQREKDTAGQV